MNTEEFRKYGKQMIDYICEYGQTIDERDVAPTVDPGFLRKLLPGTLISYPPPLRSLRKTERSTYIRISAPWVLHSQVATVKQTINFHKLRFARVSCYVG